LADPSSLRGAKATKQPRGGWAALDCVAPLAMTRQLSTIGARRAPHRFQRRSPRPRGRDHRPG
jgi:hypothetical protein